MKSLLGNVQLQGPTVIDMHFQPSKMVFDGVQACQTEEVGHRFSARDDWTIYILASPVSIAV